MTEWLKEQLASGLPGLRGTTISGTVAVHDALINELLTKWLDTERGGGAPPGPGGAGMAEMRRALAFVRRMAVRTEAGRLLVDFELGV